MGMHLVMTERRKGNGMSVITIVGSGMMGSALTFPLAENGHEIRLVGTPLDREIIEEAAKTGYHITLKRQLPAGIIYYQIDQLENALKGADILLNGVSSFGVDWFSDNILPIVSDGLTVISVTKGMQNTPEGKLITYPELLESRFPTRNLSINAIGGPCTSYELADKDHSEVCFCGKNIETLRFLKETFETSYYHISLSTDIIGVECAVAMKNAYALGVSLAVGLSERIEGIDGTIHYNSQAAIFGQSVKEMRKLMAIVGGGDEYIYLGAGDLYVTVFGGRTRLIGKLLGRGLSFDEAMGMLKNVTLESIVISRRTAAAIKSLIKQGLVKSSDFPLLLHIDDVISNGKPVDVPWASFEEDYF